MANIPNGKMTFGDIQPQTVGSEGINSAPTDPIGWMTWLEGRLGMRAGRFETYQTYYDANETDLAFAQKRFSEAFGPMFFDFRDNFCSLVCDSLSERLTVQGFRFGPDEIGDKDAKEIWQRNFLDAESISAHTDAFVCGESFISVWGDNEGNPIIMPESAREVYAQYKPGSRRELASAIKKYQDDWGTQHITLWLPDAVYTSTRANSSQDWKEAQRFNNPLGVVPIVPLRNRIRLRRGAPYSELHQVIPLQRALTKLLADAIVASEFGAYPMRILSGIELPEDEDGNVVAPIQAAIDRFLMFEDDEGKVKWGTFEASDLNNWVSLMSLIVQHVSAVTRIPPHYFLVGGSNFPSGESLQSAEAGLVRKVSERAIYFGEAWEQAMRLAFAVKGDTAKSQEFDAEVIWSEFATHSESLRIDALVKKRQGLDVPAQILWEEADYTPTQIERFPDLQQQELDFAVKKQKALAAVTGMEGGQAPAGNGTRAPKPNPAKPSQGNAGNVNKKASA